MNFIDRLVSAISPEAAYKREAWRQAATELRSFYDAGSGGGRLNAGWQVSNAAAEVGDRIDRDVIRARARDLERNSDIAQSVIRAYRRNVVGRGYQVQAKTANTTLNAEIEKQWKRWCKAEHCDVTGTQDFNDILRMAVTRKRVDGGMLIIKRYIRDSTVPFKLQCLEVDELDSLRNAPKHKGNVVVGGIEYNTWRRPEGYWIRQYDINGWQSMDSVYVPAKDVIFYYTKTRPSQIREISDMAGTLPRIRNATEFETAVSVKERIAACLAVFIKKAIPTGGVGRSASMTDGRVDYDGKTLSPGMIKEMNAGDEIQVVNPQGAATDATAFLKMELGMIGAGQGLSYEAVSRDMSQTNYSSARQGAIEDEATYVEEIELLSKLMTEVYETFVISCVLAGVINIPDIWEHKDDYLSHEWVGSPKKWIDPLKEANANQTALRTGQKTYKQIAAENGRSWKGQIDDIAEVMDYALGKGIRMEGVTFEQESANPQAEPEEPTEAGEGQAVPALQ